jgi:hypothetical protein
MLDVLGAEGPLPDYSSQLMLYGQFVGAPANSGAETVYW